MNRRRRRGGALRALVITFLLISAVLAVLLGVFRIRTMNITGNVRVSQEQIQSDLMYDFWTKNTLFFTWKYHTESYESRTPYLSGVQAEMTSPGEVTLTVKEKTVIGYVQYGGSAVSFDSDGLVLDISDQIYEGATLVTGITMSEPVLYQKLPVDDTALLRTMLSITRLMNEADINPESIDFDDNLNITAVLGSVTVLLGQDEYLEEKVANLVTIYPQVQGQSGTLNMAAFTGKNETITFREAGETEPQTEEEASQTDENSDAAAQDSDSTQAEDADTSADETVDESMNTTTGVMAFDSSGTLHYDAHIEGGQVVDSYGNPIDGCSVTEEGYIKDAYWNVINPQDGSLMNQ